MLIPSDIANAACFFTSLSRRVNANSQPTFTRRITANKLIKKGEC